MMSMPQGTEWLIILLIVVLIFGARKLPDLARSTGQSLRIFRAETRGLLGDENEQSDTDTSVAEASNKEPSGN